MKFEDLNLLSIGSTIQMSGGLWTGEGKTLLCFFPKDKNDQPLEVLEMTLEQWTAFVRQTDLLETEILTKASDGTLAKALHRKSLRQIDSAIQWRVFKRDRYTCRYCGNDDIPLTVDHLVTWEEGGPSIPDNLVASCKKDNAARGRMAYGAWLRSPHYKRVSQNLSALVRADNEALLSTLDAIPRTIHTRSR